MSYQGVAYEESGRKWTAQDIGIKERACAWMSHGFMSVNLNLGAGRAFLRSLYQQYAEWGVDFGNFNFVNKSKFCLILLHCYQNYVSMINNRLFCIWSCQLNLFLPP